MPPSSREEFVEKFRRIGNIPTLPHVATEALAIVNDPDCSVRDFSKIIERDPALATSLLKLVNSSYYAGTTKISNLTMAIVRLGLRETQNLVLAVSIRSVFRQMPKDQQEERDRLWRHCGLTGILCRHINEKLGLGFQGEEFSSGLSHDLGRIMLAIGYPDIFGKLTRSNTTDEKNLLELEHRLLGFDHADLGGWLASVWNLPDEVVQAIQFHHEPSKSPEHPVLSSVVCIGEEMANFIEMTQSLEGFDLMENPGWTLLRARWQNIKELDAEMFATAVMIDAAPQAEGIALTNIEAGL